MSKTKKKNNKNNNDDKGTNATKTLIRSFRRNHVGSRSYELRWTTTFTEVSKTYKKWTENDEKQKVARKQQPTTTTTTYCCDDDNQK